MEALNRILKHRHPTATVSYFNDVARRPIPFDKLLKLITVMRNDTNNFIITEKKQDIPFLRFADALIGSPELAGKRVEDYKFIIMRGNAISISMNKQQELDFIFRHVFRVVGYDDACPICYSEWDAQKNNVSCYRFQHHICATCAQQLHDNATYWCVCFADIITYSHNCQHRPAMVISKRFTMASNV